MNWKYKTVSGSNEVTQTSEVCRVNFGSNQTYELSHDNKYWASHGTNKKVIYVWDFDSLCGVGLDGTASSLSGLRNFSQVHEDKVEWFNFKKSRNTTRTSKSPNIICSYEIGGLIRVWCENNLKDNFSFFLAFTIRDEAFVPHTDFKLGSTPQLKWLNRHKNYDNVTRPPDFVFGDPSLGAFSVNKSNSMIITVFYPNKRLEIHKVYNCFNVGKQIHSDPPKVIKNPDFNKIKHIVTVNITGDEIQQLVGIDMNNSLIKIQIHVKNLKETLIFQNNKMHILNIKLFDYSFLDNAYSFIDSESNLKVYKIIDSYIPQNVKKQERNYNFSAKLSREIVKSTQFMFYIKDFNILFNGTLDKIVIISQKSTNVFLEGSLAIMEALLIPQKEILGQDITMKLQQVVENTAEGKLLLTFGLQIKRRIVIFTFALMQNLIIKEIQSKVPNNKACSQKYPLPATWYKPIINYDHTFYHNVLQKMIIPLTPGNSEDYLVTMKTSPTEIKTYKVNIVKKNLIDMYTITLKNEFIISFTISKEEQHTLCVVSDNRDLQFYNLKGYQLVRFKMNDFLMSINNARLHIDSLNMKILPIRDNFFLQLLENYCCFQKLSFSKQTHSYYVYAVSKDNLIANRATNSAEPRNIYYRKIEDYRYKPEDFVKMTSSNSLMILSDGKINHIDGFFEPNAYNTIKKLKVPSTFYFKQINTSQLYRSHHPKAILQLQFQGRMDMVEFIALKLRKWLDGQEDFKGCNIDKYDTDFTEMIQLLNQGCGDTNTNVVTSFMFSENSNRIEDVTSNLVKIKEIAENNKIGYEEADIGILDSIVDIFQEIGSNSRGYDKFAIMFQIHYKTFLVSRSGNSSLLQRTCLETRELCWALNSLQKDSLFNVCIHPLLIANGEYNDEQLNWDTLKRYGVVLWYDDMTKFKQIIIKIAQMHYKKNKDPYAVMLWYIILGMTKVLIPLFKLEADAAKIVTFLSHDFKQEKWSKAAYNNAFVLLGQKKYQMSASFFLQGGKFADAVDVMCSHMQDIQMAVLACKLLESPNSKSIEDKPVLKKILQTRFIDVGLKMGDPWQTCMGNMLLGNHIESVNCLYKNYDGTYKEEINIDHSIYHRVCDEWPAAFQPYLSSFHPSLLFLANLMKNKTEVKTELKNKNSQNSGGGMGLGGYGGGMGLGGYGGGGMGLGDYGLGGLTGGGGGGGSLFDPFGGFNEPSKKESRDNFESESPKVEIEEDLIYYSEHCFGFYQDIEMPWIGLLWNYFMTNSGFSLLKKFNEEEIIDNKKSIDIANYLQLDHLLIKSVLHDDWKGQFSALTSEIKQLSTCFGIENWKLTNKLQNKIGHLKSPKQLIAWHQASEDGKSAVEIAMKFSQEIQNYSTSIIKSNNFELKQRNFWLNINYFIEELSHCLILIESKSSIFKRRNQSRSYSLTNNELPVIKDQHEQDCFNLNEKIVIMISQNIYQTQLVAINLGCWNEACLIIEHYKWYLGKVINDSFVSWKDLWEKVYKNCLININARINKDYPNFNLKNPRHYLDLDALKKLFEAEDGDHNSKIETDCEKFQELKGPSKIILRTVFRWMFNDHFMCQISKNFKLEGQNMGLHQTMTMTMSSLYELIQEYSLYQKNDFFKFLSEFKVSEQNEISNELGEQLRYDCNINMLNQYYLDPKVDLHIDLIKQDFRKLLNTPHYVQIIKDIITLKLFVFPNDSNDSKIKKLKKGVFGDGIEVFLF